MGIGFSSKPKLEFLRAIISPNFSYVFSPTLVTSISNALFGVLAGHWLMSDKEGNKKARGLLKAEITSIPIALIAQRIFLTIKNLRPLFFMEGMRILAGNQSTRMQFKLRAWIEPIDPTCAKPKAGGYPNILVFPVKFKIVMVFLGGWKIKTGFFVFFV